MWRLLFLFSGIVIIAALVARWWFGIRVLDGEGKRICRCDLDRWIPAPGDESVVHRADQSASEFGKELRLKALADWKNREPKAAAARESAKRFGLAVPPLSAMVAIFAAIVAKIPIFGALAVVLAATGLATLLGVLSLAPELQAITAAARKLREEKIFRNRDDEDAVIRSAIAHSWNQTLRRFCK